MSAIVTNGKRLSLDAFAAKQERCVRCFVCKLPAALQTMIDAAQKTGPKHRSDFLVQKWLQEEHDIKIGLTPIGAHRRQRHAERR